MASRVMHYYIAVELEQQLKVDSAQFILGNLAPDVYESSSRQKNRSHFMQRGADGLIYIDFAAFEAKYCQGEISPFVLGYYCHLLTDDLWLNEIYYKKIRWLPEPAKSRAKKAYYRDFRRLNKKLIDHFALTPPKFRLEKPESPIAEIDGALLPQLLQELHRDFQAAKTQQTEQQEILTFTEIVELLQRISASCLASFPSFGLSV